MSSQTYKHKRPTSQTGWKLLIYGNSFACSRVCSCQLLFFLSVGSTTRTRTYELYIIFVDLCDIYANHPWSGRNFVDRFSLQMRRANTQLSVYLSNHWGKNWLSYRSIEVTCTVYTDTQTTRASYHKCKMYISAGEKQSRLPNDFCSNAVTTSGKSKSYDNIESFQMWTIFY